MKLFPAIDVRTADTDLLLAIVDDHRATAIEERDDRVRVFFQTAGDRDAARSAVAKRFDVTSVDVPDEDWARRSQENLTPIVVGRITVAPPWAALSSQLSAFSGEPSAIEVVILPSMGFGTGHHVTTRLCLAALQTIELKGLSVLDVGTGSGVLAIAADLLGAASALGMDNDADAIQSARESLALNPAARHAGFETMDLAEATLPSADVVTANLTGALLIRSASLLLTAVRPHGTLILSGIQSSERDAVRQAFGDAQVCWEREEDGWVGLAVKKA